MIKNIFFLFIFFAPFTSFFALSGWLRLPVVINQVLFLALIFVILQKGKLKSKWLLKEDLLLLGFLILVWLSFLLGFREQRSFNHSLAYTNSVIFYFFVSKYTIKLLNISSLEISKIVYKSFLFCSFIIIVDFIGINYFNIGLRNIFSSVDGVTSNMDYFIRAKMLRVGGVAEEPGHMAIFYNIYFGISMFYIHKRDSVKRYIWIILLFIISHFALFSSAGIVLPVFALFFIFIFNKLKRLKISKNQIQWLLAVLLLILISGLSVIIFDGDNAKIFSEFINKIIFNDENNSSSMARLYQWSRALSNFTHHPVFGYGPGYGVNEDPEGYLSVYLTILADTGVVAFAFFILFLTSLTLKVKKIHGFIGDILIFCIIISFLHLIIISDFYHAPLWILFVFIQLVYSETQKSEVI